MGQIALSLVTVFIIVAMIIDIKESRGVSHAVWIPFLWFAVSISKPLSYWIRPRAVLEWSPIYDAQGNSTERTFLFTLMVLGLFILYKRRHNFRLIPKDNMYLFAFFFFALLSVSWSEYQGPAFKRWIRAAGDIIIISTILSEDNPQEAFERILRRCAIVLIPLSVYYIKFERLIGILYYHDGLPRFVGATGNKNQLGILCAFTGIFMAWRLLSRMPRFNIVDLVLIFFAMYLLNLSNSATSLVLFFMGTIVLMVQFVLNTDKKKLMRVIVFSFVFLILVQVVFVSVLGDSVLSMFFSTAGRDSSFTGRIPLWQSLLEIGSHRPFLGFGFGSFWISDQALDLWNIYVWRPTTGHNGYLDVFMDLGLIGFILLALLIINTSYRILASYELNNNFHRLQLVLLLMCLMHNVTESSFGSGSVFVWVIFLWMSVTLRKPESPKET